MTQKIVIKVSCNNKCRRATSTCGKCKSKILKVAAVEPGVSSLGLEGADKDELVVIGNGVDPVCLAKALRKKFNVAQIIKVEEIKEDKKDEKKDSLPPWSYAPGYYCPPYPQSVVYENPYGSQCIIM
ncbi:heavy metal-associated isoprenylated plant protein 47-like [Arachis duranensis]|uniref:Heavy metal-associated isoprenylated plant protein 47-like n=1 Tax=Arachis duranensis TaxID=130453 RepID=A0A6P4DV68_ARADU|nr:heavy metal-associated isoprenylated plant protein 47-like [Arachis duranensis]